MPSIGSWISAVGGRASYSLGVYQRCRYAQDPSSGTLPDMVDHPGLATLAGPRGPFHVAATRTGHRRRRLAGLDELRSMRSWRRGSALPIVARPTAAPGDPARRRLEAAIPALEALLDGRARRRLATSPSTCATGPPGTSASCARSASLPLGRDRELRRDRPPGRRAARGAGRRRRARAQPDQPARSRATGSSPRTARSAATAATARSTATGSLERKRGLLLREGVTVGRRDARLPGRTRQAGDRRRPARAPWRSHDRSAAARPVDVRGLPQRDFSLLWLAQLVSTAGSALTDLAAGICVYRETGVGPGRRPDPDGHGRPEPRRRPARRRLRRPPRPQARS